MERVILFGAGASYGAEHILPDAPPLGKDIYAELSRCFPGSWGALPKDIKDTFTEGFEQGMQLLWDRCSSSIAPLMRHMTLYLAQFRPDGSLQDLYSRLFAELKDQGVAGGVLYSTLNYECVLELAASARGMTIEYGEGETSADIVRIWKLHGSCNFISANLQVGGGISFSRGIVFEGGLRPVDPNDAIQYCLSNTGLYPAMALYMDAKPIQIGQAVVHQIQKRWGEVVRNAKRVLIVGVHPYPQDAHIWGPLAQSQGELAYVGPKQAFENWMRNHRQGELGQWLGAQWDQCFSETVSFISEG